MGAIAGAFEQELRAVFGIKKAGDEAAAGRSTFRSEGLQVSRLIFILFIGAIAGGIGIVMITGFRADTLASITAEMFIGTVSIGYAGADFNEGFVRMQFPKVEPLTRTFDSDNF